MIEAIKHNARTALCPTESGSFVTECQFGIRASDASFFGVYCYGKYSRIVFDLLIFQQTKAAGVVIMLSNRKIENLCEEKEHL